MQTSYTLETYNINFEWIIKLSYFSRLLPSPSSCVIHAHFHDQSFDQQLIIRNINLHTAVFSRRSFEAHMTQYLQIRASYLVVMLYTFFLNFSFHWESLEEFVYTSLSYQQKKTRWERINELVRIGCCWVVTTNGYSDRKFSVMIIAST